MSDSESAPLFPLFPGRPWLEAVAVSGTLLAANSIAAPQDPGWLSLNPTPWLLLPVITGLAHGFRWGFLFGAAASVALWAALPVLRPAVPLPELVFFFSFPLAGLIAGGASRAAISDRLRQREQRLAQAHGLELESLSGQRRELAASLDQSRAETAFAEKRLTARETETVRISHALAAALARESTLREAAKEAALRAAEAGERHAALAAELAAREVALQSLRNSHSLLTGRLALEGESLKHLAADRETLTARLHEKDHAIQQLTAERDLLASQLAELRAGAAASKSAGQPDDRHQALETLIADQNVQAEALTAQVEEQGRQLENALAEREKLGAQMATLQSRADLAGRQALMVEALTAERDELMARIAGHAELAAQLEDRSRAIHVLSAERDELASQLAAQEELAALIAERDRTIAALTADRVESAALLSNLQDLTSQVEERDLLLGTLTTERDELASQLASQEELAARIAERDRTIAALTADRVESAALLSNLQDLTSQVEERDLLLGSLTTERDELASQLAAQEELTARIGERDRTIAALTAGSDELTAQLSGLQTLTSQLAAQDQELAALKADRDQLSSRLASQEELTVRIEDRDRTVAALTASHEELTSKLEEQHQTLAALIAERDELAAGFAASEGLTNQLHEHIRAIESLTAERDGLVLQLSGQQDLTGQIARLDSSVSELMQERETLTARLAARDGELLTLRAGHEDLTRLLAEAESRTAAALVSHNPDSSFASPEPLPQEPAPVPGLPAADSAAFEELCRERDALQAKIGELEQTALALQAAHPESQADEIPGPTGLSFPAERGQDPQHAEQLASLTRQLEERETILESLTAERDLLAAHLQDREEALRRAEEMREALNVRLADRNALLESMAGRPASPPPRRRSPRSNVSTSLLRPHSAKRPAVPADEAIGGPFPDGLAPDDSGQLQETFQPFNPGTAPAEERIREFFAPGAGPVFPQLLRLLEDIDGVTDAAFYQIDGESLLRMALLGADGELPETLPLAEVEIAHLAVRRQSFVTCRQVLTTVPTQSSQWLAALPWPTAEMQSPAILLIHRMHPGAVNRRAFSHIQMLCRWVALFMELHGHPASPDAGANSRAPVTTHGPLLVTPQVLHRAIADAAATHRAHALPSSSLSLTLASEEDSHSTGIAAAAPFLTDVLVQTILPHLRSTDLLAILPHQPGSAAPGSLPPPSAATTEASRPSVSLEILLTFSDFDEAEALAQTITDTLQHHDQLKDHVTAPTPTLIGSPALT